VLVASVGMVIGLCRYFAGHYMVAMIAGASCGSVAVAAADRPDYRPPANDGRGRRGMIKEGVLVVLDRIPKRLPF
jgi:hypothetical protein